MRAKATLPGNAWQHVLPKVRATGVNGLSTAVPSTGPFCTEVALPVAQQIYLVSDLSQYWFELSVQTAGGASCNIYGLRFKVRFNFN